MGYTSYVLGAGCHWLLREDIHIFRTWRDLRVVWHGPPQLLPLGPAPRQAVIQVTDVVSRARENPHILSVLINIPHIQTLKKYLVFLNIPQLGGVYVRRSSSRSEEAEATEEEGGSPGRAHQQA